MLITDHNIPNPDDFYEALIQAHEGLSTQDRVVFNARLILILANRIGDVGSLKQALKAAKNQRPKQRRACPSLLVINTLGKFEGAKPLHLPVD